MDKTLKVVKLIIPSESYEWVNNHLEHDPQYKRTAIIPMVTNQQFNIGDRIILFEDVGGDRQGREILTQVIKQNRQNLLLRVLFRY